MTAVLTACALLSALPREDPNREAEGRLVLAVLPVKNQTGDSSLDPAEDGLGDVLAIMLDGAAGVRVVDRASVSKVMAEKKLALAGLADTALAVRAGALLDADRIVVGTLAPAEAGVEVICNLVHVADGRIVHTSREAGSVESLLDLVEKSAVRIARGMKISVQPLQDADFDESPRISLKIMRGYAFYHQGLPDRAQVEFMGIVARDATHETARLWIAKCYLSAGRYRHGIVACDWFLARLPNSPHRAQIVDIRKQCEDRRAEASVRGLP